MNGASGCKTSYIQRYPLETAEGGLSRTRKGDDWARGTHDGWNRDKKY